MKLSRGYKFLILPNKKQKSLLFHTFFTSNQRFNICLSLNQKEFKHNQILESLGLKKTYLSDTEIDKQVKKILTNRNLSFNKVIRQTVRRQFKKDLNLFIKSLKKDTKKGGFKFKNSRDELNHSFTIRNKNYTILDYINPITGKSSKKYKILRIFRQLIKIRWTRDLPSNPTNLTISHKNGNFYVSFNTTIELKSKNNKHSKEFHRNENNIKKLKNGIEIKPIGMDINIDNIDLGGNGGKFHKKYKNKSKKDNLIKINEKKIKRLQRKQSRRILKRKKTKTKIGKNFYKTQNKINKLFIKNTNKKMFNLHQLTNEIIKDIKENGYNTLVVEDLNIKQMTIKTTQKNKIKLLGKKKTKEMKKNILQISFGKLLNILKYKCAENEIYFIKVDPKYTSKTCCKCKNINHKLNLSNRIYDCIKCDNIMDRDLNSCNNIIFKGMETVLYQSKR